MLSTILLAFVASCGGGGNSGADGGADAGGDGSGTDGGGDSAAVATVTVSPAMVSILVGGTQAFVAQASDASGATVGGVTFGWTSDNPYVASIDDSGVATGLGQGKAEIYAAVGSIISDPAVLSVVPVPAEPLVITSGPPDPPVAGSAYSFHLSASGGTPPYTWEATILSPDQMANGIELDENSGLISGTPIYTGSIPFSVTVRDSEWRYTMVQYDLTVGGTGSSRMITNSPPGGVAGQPYAFRFETTWSSELGCDPSLLLINGSLPPGLTLNTLTGDLGEPPAASGTPIAAGSYTFSASAYTNEYCIAPPLETNAHTFTIEIGPGSGGAPPGASGWTRSAAPALSPTPGTWEESGLRSPSVVLAGATYYLFYEAQSASDHTTRIGLATSADGLTWSRAAQNPIVETGPAGSWDGFEVRYPMAHHDGTVFRLWYWGKSDLDANQAQSGAMIGLATSIDGLTWEKHPGPVFGTEWGGQGLIPGSVLTVGDQLVMYYATQFGNVGRATSPDGVTWTDAGEVIEYAGSRPAVVQDGSVFRMWFTKSNSFGGGIASGADLYNVTIASATSPDGITWIIFEQNPSVCFFCKTTEDWVPALSMGPQGTFDHPGVGEPSVIRDGSVFRMWYAGGLIQVPGFGSMNSILYVSGSIGSAQVPAN